MAGGAPATAPDVAASSAVGTLDIDIVSKYSLDNFASMSNLATTTARSSNAYDYVLVGGGLQNALVALAVLARTPEARIALIEEGSSIGGNHTWCFHAEDVSLAATGLIEPLVTAAWPDYEVSFPRLNRTIEAQYRCITSERLDAVVRAAFARHANASLHTGARARALTKHEVTLEDGTALRARLVVDARGPERYESPPDAVGYQKFVGLEFAVSDLGPALRPTLMDATVPQLDGFRFFYTLPFSRNRVLVEDTRFSNGPELDVAAMRAEIVAYAHARGLRVEGVVREEAGVLPLPTRLVRRASDEGALVAGYQGGWFHPTTGYSFPVALRLAEHIASVAPEDVVGPEFEAFSERHQKQVKYALLLNRLLFGAFAPEDRWNVLERFYRLPEPTIRRFYAMTTTAGDRARILCGRPPRGLSLRMAFSRGIAS